MSKLIAIGAPNGDAFRTPSPASGGLTVGNL
jgi:hypothetical protein